MINYGEEGGLFAEKRGKPIAITLRESENTTFYNKKYSSKVKDTLHDVGFDCT